MKKNFVNIKGFKLQTNESGWSVLRDNVEVAEIDKYGLKTIANKGVLAYFKRELEGKKGIKITGEEKAAIKRLHEKEKEKIEKWLNNLDEIKFYCLNYRYYYIDKETEGYKDMEDLNEDLLHEVKTEWLERNKQYLVETDRVQKTNDFGMMMAPTIYYVFKKENIEKVEKEKEEYRKTDEYKRKMEKQEQFYKLHELAQKTNDEEFEDVTGLQRENYL